MRSYILAVFLLATSLGACKKNDPNQNTPKRDSVYDCSLVSITRNYGDCHDSSDLFFKDGLVEKFLTFSDCKSGMHQTITSSTRSFVYSNGMVIITDAENIDGQDTLIVDDSMRILEQRTHPKHVGGTITAAYKHNNGTLVSGTFYFNGNAYDSTVYTFRNGDMLSQVSAVGNDTLSFDYDLTQNVPPNGHFTQLSNLRQGSAFLYKNVHLIKAQVRPDGIPINSWTYEKDSNGNITKVIRKDLMSNTSDTTNYHYLCAVE